MESKKWYTSKTLWANAIAGVAIMAQAFTGKELFPAEAQTGALALINMILRVVTKTGLA